MGDGLEFLDADPVSKGGGHRYTKRTGSKGHYRYEYDDAGKPKSKPPTSTMSYSDNFEHNTKHYDADDHGRAYKFHHREATRHTHARGAVKLFPTADQKAHGAAADYHGQMAAAHAAHEEGKGYTPQGVAAQDVAGALKARGLDSYKGSRAAEMSIATRHLVTAMKRKDWKATEKAADDLKLALDHSASLYSGDMDHAEDIAWHGERAGMSGPLQAKVRDLANQMTPMVKKSKASMVDHDLSFLDPDPMSKAGGSKPPSGYTRIPGTKHEGYRKKKGPGWDYWYPTHEDRKAGIQHHATKMEEHRSKREAAQRAGDQKAVAEHADHEADHAHAYDSAHANTPTTPFPSGGAVKVGGAEPRKAAHPKFEGASDAEIASEKNRDLTIRQLAFRYGKTVEEVKGILNREAKNKPAVWKSDGLEFLDLDPLAKAGGHKYKRKVAVGGGKYRYIYDDGDSTKKMKAVHEAAEHSADHSADDHRALAREHGEAGKQAGDLAREFKARGSGDGVSPHMAQAALDTRDHHEAMSRVHRMVGGGKAKGKSNHEMWSNPDVQANYKEAQTRHEAAARGMVKKSEASMVDHDLSFLDPDPLTKGSGAKPPGGYSAIPGSKRGGFRKKNAGGWAYWYPDQQSAHSAKLNRIKRDKPDAKTPHGYPKDTSKPGAHIEMDAAIHHLGEMRRHNTIADGEKAAGRAGGPAHSAHEFAMEHHRNMLHHHEAKITGADPIFAANTRDGAAAARKDVDAIQRRKGYDAGVKDHKPSEHAKLAEAQTAARGDGKLDPKHLQAGKTVGGADARKLDPKFAQAGKTVGGADARKLDPKFAQAGKTAEPKMVHGRQAVGAMMHNWHTSGGDPVYAVGSMLVAGKPADVKHVEAAKEQLSRDLKDAQAGKYGWGPSEVKELKSIVKHLDVISTSPAAVVRKSEAPDLDGALALVKGGAPAPPARKERPAMNDNTQRDALDLVNKVGQGATMKLPETAAPDVEAALRKSAEPQTAGRFPNVRMGSVEFMQSAPYEMPGSVRREGLVRKPDLANVDLGSVEPQNLGDLPRYADGRLMDPASRLGSRSED